MCFWPELVTPSNKSAQMALGWDMWFPTNLCRRAALAPEDSPSLPFVGICPKSCGSVAVLQAWGDVNICLSLSFLLKDGWMAGFLFHTSMGGAVLPCLLPLCAPGSATHTQLPAASEQQPILHLCPCLQLQNEPDWDSGALVMQKY